MKAKWNIVIGTRRLDKDRLLFTGGMQVEILQIHL